MDREFKNNNQRKKKVIRVLHVFPPSFTSRFGGQIIWWKYCFFHWNDSNVVHYVLDCDKNQLVDSRQAFNYEYPDTQKETSRWERAVWLLALFGNIKKYEEKYDLLHVHVLWWATLLLGPWAKWKNIPTVYESILLDSDTPGGILKTKLGRIQVRCLKTYKAILAITDHLAEDFRKFGFSEKQVFTLVNCVDTDLFFPSKSAEEKTFLRQKLSLPQDAKILVFVGSVIERKGADLLIRAFIQASSINPNLYLLIVGPKDKNENPSLNEEFVNELHALIQQKDLMDKVSFRGLVQDRQRLAELYRASDIFVFPSRKEGLGNVVLEAMAAGLPLVVSRLPVLENIIKHEENGLFVPIEDSNALKDSILLLSSDRALARKIGDNARFYVETNLGFADWQAELVEFYKRLIYKRKNNKK